MRDVFVAAFLLDVAGDGAFARGAIYGREDRVRLVVNEPDRVEAIVQGGESYAVIPGARHAAPLTRPETLAAALAAFFASVQQPA